MKTTFIVLCFAISAFAAVYKDSLARNKLYPAAASAYVKNPSTCFANTFSNGKIQRRISVECDETNLDTCVGYSAYSTDEKVIVLVFRGTDNNIELVMEGIESVYDKDVPWIGGGNVSKYFNDGFMKIWNTGMKDDFATLTNKYPSYQLYITGHSLGGALAALCASYITSQNLFPLKQTVLYTFGEPRVGDKEFADKFDKTVPVAYRVVHHKDIVPHVPQRFIEQYHHHEAEVWYQEDMTPGAEYKVCSFQDESLRCSDRDIIDINLDDHVTYFNVTLHPFGNGGCKYPTSLLSKMLLL